MEVVQDSRHIKLVEDPKIDTEHNNTTRILYLIWPGNACGPPGGAERGPG